MGDSKEEGSSRIEEETKQKEDAPPKEESSSSEPAVKKKRTAERQITKGDEDGEDDDGAEPADLNGPFAKASDEVLAKRKIVKVKRPATSTSTASSSSSSSNPFASTTLLANPKNSGTEGSGSKVFGSNSTFSGFGAFGSSSSAASGFGASSSNGFRAAANGTSKSIGFGSTTSAFGGTKESEEEETKPSLFGNSNSTTSGFSFGFAKPSASSASTADSATSKAAVALPENVELTTGEEDEIKMHEVRCKSFKWVIETKKFPPKESTNTSETNPSVKPSSNFENKPQESETVDDKASEGTTEHRWQELGIGPIKILRSCDFPDKFRMVQRRESTPNGAAHKVILNVPLWKESTCKKTSEKHLSVTTVGASGKGETYALKFKEAAQAAGFSDCISGACSQAKSCFT